MLPPTGLARRVALIIVSILALAAWVAPAARAISDRADDLPVVDGEVLTTLRTPERIYVGGSFNHVSTRTGPFFLADAAGAPRLPTPDVSGGRDEVRAMSPDGAGGYIIVGSFTHVGGLPRQNAAHILADGSVDPGWVANVPGEVFAVGHSGSAVYIGGQFSSVDGQARTNLAAVDLTTGQPTSFAPVLTQSVGVLAVSGSSVYFSFGGGTVNGVARTQAAAVDATTGATLAWNPEPNGAVAAIEPAAGKVYLGGIFTQIKGATRKYFAAVDATSGADTGFESSVDGGVTALAVSGSTIYAGGLFTHVGATAVGHAAAFDLNGNFKPAWTPGPDGLVWSIATDGSTVYLGGEFRHVDGTLERSGFAAVDATTGVATGWAPSTNLSISYNHLIALSGSNVAIGGDFNQAGGVVRHNVAAFSATDGTLLPWNPGPDGIVHAIADDGSGYVYIGGRFEHIDEGTVRRFGLAQVTADTGAATIMNIDAGEVRAMALAGNILYVGGQISNLGPELRDNIGAIDLSIDTVTNFDPRVFNGFPSAMFVRGSTLYVVGDFDTASGGARAGAAAFPTTPTYVTANAWNPGVGDVRAMAERGGTIYLGTEAGTVKAVDDVTGAPVPGFGLSVTNSGLPEVDAVAVIGDTLYVGGSFEAVNGVARHEAAAVDATTGAVLPWNPGPDSLVSSLSADPSGSLTMGGYFTTTEQDPVSGFASYSDQPTVLTPPSASGNPVAGSTLTCGGFSFGGARPQTTGFAWLRDGGVLAGATGQQLAVGTGDVGHTFACRVTARNLGGSASADSAGVAISTAASLAARDRKPPKVSALKLTPSSFRAASKGGSIGAKASKKKKKTAASGTVVSYKIDEAAKVTFTVQRPEPGRRKGKSCVKPTKKLAKAKPCTRYVPFKATFTRTIKKAGPDHFAFTGRLAGKPLPRGSYRLSLVAVDAAHNKAAPVAKPFHITGAT